ncbi:MAG: hypothetical protein Q9198_004552 [Flavoplaca austrocitrina]
MNKSYEKLRTVDKLNGRLQNQFPVEPLNLYDPYGIASLAGPANDEKAGRLLAKSGARAVKSKGFRPEMDQDNWQRRLLRNGNDGKILMNWKARTGPDLDRKEQSLLLASTLDHSSPSTNQNLYALTFEDDRGRREVDGRFL